MLLSEKLYHIGELEGFSPQIGRLVSMMNYTRHTTLRAVHGLSIKELDFHLDSQSNSIGMLLYHFADVEKIYQILTFENREPTEFEEKELELGLDLGKKGQENIKGYPLDFYLDRLEKSRNETLKQLQQRSDDWLDETTPFWNNLTANNYFKWFHVFEDELNHRGQIRMIRKRFIG